MSRNSVIRLHQYRKSVYRLKLMGLVKVFSENLADAVNVTAAQVRRDFSSFGFSGKKRGGYNVDELIQKMDQKLGKDREQKVIVVGAGNVGRALTNYKGFETEKIKIAAIFDNDESKVARSAIVPVLPMSELKSFVKDNEVEVAVLAVPDSAAQSVLTELVHAGIRGVLNFAPVRLTPPYDDFVISHVNVGLELETVIYLTHSMKEN